MKLFWKNFVSMFFSFVVIVTSTSYIISVKQISDVERNIIEERQILGSFIAKEVEVGYFESKWPFESLKKLSEYKGFLFWWIVRDDGTIHLADNTSFMGTNAHDYFPQIANLAEKEKVSLNRDQNRAIFFKPLETGKNKWSFWFGFSLREVSERRAEIIFLITAVSMSALGALGVILFFALKHFTKPVKELTLGATTIGKGDLTYRVKIESKDELGQLADTFNKMTEDLQKTTVSKDYVNNIIDSMMDVLIVVDPGGKIRTVNKATCDLLGYKENDLMGQSMETIFLTPGEILAQKNMLEKLNEKDDTRNYETYFKAKGGRKIPVILSSSVMRNSNTTCVVLIGKDITEKKKAEEERAALQEQLRQAQKMEAIGTLAGGIAHDFNNILAGILGYAELASLDIPEGSEAKINLQQSIKSTNRAKDLVQQILAFSRQSKQERKPLDIRPIIKEALKLLRASLPSTIEIRQNIEADWGAIEADPTQIHQVLMNLCTNAAHAMSEDGGVLEVSLTKFDMDAGTSGVNSEIEPGPYLKLRVSDTGSGMPPEILSRIFDPYFTTKETGKGTGLGLAVVHGIVKSHRGAITVSSEPGKGTTFDIYFPRDDIIQAPSELERIEPLPLGGRERVLFVDDEKAIVDIGQKLLERLGYEVVGRTSSVEALELFRAKPESFDLVITDMTMPNMTGDKLARELMGIRPGIPVILCTGFSERITEEKAKLLGIREFVLKPLVMKDLAKSMRRALDR
ncbi:MAG: ATP-binding protein [Deltaproteobacteria bacterium]|nr:ATP-binding protein [Deltaproteobacteria bacterium]